MLFIVRVHVHTYVCVDLTVTVICSADPAGIDESGYSVGKLLYESMLPWLPDAMIYIQDRLLPQRQQPKVTPVVMIVHVRVKGHSCY